MQDMKVIPGYRLDCLLSCNLCVAYVIRGIDALAGEFLASTARQCAIMFVYLPLLSKF